MKNIMFILLSACLLMLSACGNQQIDEFSYTNHRGEEVSLESLKGTPWLATFVFTNCDTVCPPMTFNMAVIQEELESEGLEDYKIVAFSVDPMADTPEKMQQYLSNFSVPDESKWNLLTGYSQQEIEEFAKDSFQTFIKNDPNSDQVIHGTSFYLVDQEGEITNNYDGYEDVPIDQIREDMENLLAN